MKLKKLKSKKFSSLLFLHFLGNQMDKNTLYYQRKQNIYNLAKMRIFVCYSSFLLPFCVFLLLEGGNKNSWGFRLEIMKLAHNGNNVSSQFQAILLYATKYQNELLMEWKFCYNLQPIQKKILHGKNYVIFFNNSG